MNRFEHINPPGPNDLSDEWDGMAAERHKQIVSGADLSFHHVIAPAVMSMLATVATDRVLDIGAGTGELTAKIATMAKAVTAVEPSRKSISIAKNYCAKLNNVTFINKSLEAFVKNAPGKTYTAAVASMVLSATADLTGFAKCLRPIMEDGSFFIFTIPHPCFWPRYWGYEKASWFDYKLELFIKSRFRISAGVASKRTTHIHRPLEKYISEFSRAGFSLVEFRELFPSTEVHKLYADPWCFPRFLALKWVAIK